jgi:thioredoxin
MVSRRRLLFVGSTLVGLALMGRAMAEEAPFTPQAFDSAQKAGKPILVEVHAVWCPTCKAQIPILGKLTAEPKFKDMVVLRVDFDNQKEIVRKFGVQMQSTLIVYKGNKEVGRSVGDTKADSIAALLDKSI